MKTYETCRKDFPSFFYHNYAYTETPEALQVTYHFEIPGLASFSPVWAFPKPDEDPLQPERDARLQTMLFSLGMVELISYWKIACPPKVIIRAGALDREQILWWKKLYFLGLGEFFYTNGIEADPDSFMEIVSEGSGLSYPSFVDAQFSGAEQASDSNRLFRSSQPSKNLHGCLVPVGGGKDSACTLELLKKSGLPLKSYIINPRGATRKTVEAAGLNSADSLNASRTLDQRMLELNREGYLNGHTPFSALVAFSSLITAYLHGLEYIALSNESSANESTVAGSSVNHQYSKSFEFERDFHEYKERYIGSGVYYFSMLRPLSEFQIAKYFSGLGSYHDIFRSCNAGSKTDVWCGHCPKCLFVFLILSPFLSHTRLTEIFGTDMLEDESMLTDFRKLTGLASEKPFECVGSRDEVNAAICLTIEQMEDSGERLPRLLAWYREQPLYAASFPQRHAFERRYDPAHLLPPAFLKILTDECYGGELPCCAD
ncbi:MAG: hypothetical protein LUE31_10725 [Lachnospiraceae bacterium]|nr:hypothetical protein [Lachnospiraceae bacterium]